MRPFARFHAQADHERFVDGLIAEYHLRKRIEQLQNWRMNGIRTVADGERFEAEKARREGLATGATGAATDTKLKLSLSATESAGTKRKRAGEESLISSKKSKLAGASPTGPLLDITGMEGYDLLSESERKLCSELQLMPVHFFTVKNKILQEFTQRGVVDRSNAGQLLQIGALTFACRNVALITTYWFLPNISFRLCRRYPENQSSH